MSRNPRRGVLTSRRRSSRICPPPRRARRSRPLPKRGAERARPRRTRARAGSRTAPFLGTSRCARSRGRGRAGSASARDIAAATTTRRRANRSRAFFFFFFDNIHSRESLPVSSQVAIVDERQHSVTREGRLRVTSPSGAEAAGQSSTMEDADRLLLRALGRVGCSIPANVRSMADVVDGKRAPREPRRASAHSTRLAKAQRGHGRSRPRLSRTQPRPRHHPGVRGTAPRA